MEFFSEHWGSMFSVLGVAISVIGLFVKLEEPGPRRKQLS